MIMNDDNNSNNNNINNQWKKNIEQLTSYKDISEITLERCDEIYLQTKKTICQDFDTLINYLTDRKIEILQQLGEELESHKQEIESNRDKSMMLIEHLNKKINGISTNSHHPPSSSQTSGGGGGGGLTHSTSFNGNLNINNNNNNNSYLNYHLSASSGIASSTSSSSMLLSNSCTNLLSLSTPPLSPLKKSTSFQTDYLQVLKESISIIEWDWIGEFQDDHTTNAKIIKQAKPLSTMVTDIMLNINGIDGSNTSSNYFKNIENLNEKFQQHNNDSDNNEYTGADKSNKKKVNIFGKLKFKITETEEYTKLNSTLSDSKLIFSIGGKFEGAFDQYSIEKYDFKEGLWRSLQPITSIMDNDFTGNFDGKNHIYIFGGSLSPNRVLKYNILEDQWEKIINKEQQQQQQSQQPQSLLLSSSTNAFLEIPDNGRFLHSSVFDKKQNIYLIGGFPRSTNILKFNITTEQFTRQSSTLKNLCSIGAVYSDKYYIKDEEDDNNDDGNQEGDEESNNNSNSNSNGSGSGSGSLINGPSIYLVGGCNITRQSVDTFERYDIESDKFFTLPSLPIACYSAGVIFDEKEHYIYVFGGYNSKENKCLSIIQRFDLIENKWQLLDYDDRLKMPKPMMINGNSVVFDHLQRSIYILGGYNNVTKESIDSIFSINLSNINNTNDNNDDNTTTSTNSGSFWEINKINSYKNSKLKGGTSILIQK